jgi:probable F420-dependent oxidoreductase
MQSMRLEGTGMGTAHPLRFGVVNERPLPAAEWVGHVQRVEALGYDTFLVRDHLTPDFYGPQYAPLATMATAAAVTSRLRVGTMVIDNDFRHPAILAKEIATIDVLSGGRVELGIGAGWLREEYERAGIQYDRPGVRIDRLEEALPILKGLLGGETVAWHGDAYQIDGLTNFPAAQQRPHPPIMVGGGKRRVLTLAGREADIVGVLTSSVATGTLISDPRERLPESVEEKLSWIRDGAGERFDAIELSLFPMLVFTDVPEDAAMQLIERNNWAGISVDDVLSMPSMFFGDARSIARLIVERRDRYGFTYFVISDKDMEAFAPVVALLGRNTAVPA